MSKFNKLTIDQFELHSFDFNDVILEAGIPIAKWKKD